MLRSFFGLLLMSLLVSTSLNSQTADSPNALAGRYIASNYHWPLELGNGFSTDDFSNGVELEYFRYLSDHFDLSFPLRVTTSIFPQTPDGSVTTREGSFGLNALINYNIYKGKVFRPRVFAGFGGLLPDGEDLKTDVPIGLGLNFHIHDGVSLATSFVYHLSNEDLRDHYKVGIGLRVDINAKKPAPVLDRDGDGILDVDDNCPDVKGVVALNGCPDKDHDGITDSKDNCPDVAGIAKFEGCPDTDNDGLMDSEDNCPETAGPVDNKGCPITDRDGDGIDDGDDDCPDVVGTVANKGCPEKSMIVTAKDKITGEVLPNTEIAVLNGSGQVVKTGTTNSLGIVELENIPPGDYSIDGKLYDIALESADIKSSEFNTSEPVQKTIYYNDPNFIVQGKVFYCNSPTPLPSVTLNLKNNADNFMKSTVSDATGQFIFHLSNRATYELYAKKESFLSQVVDVDANNYDREKSVFVRLEVCAEEVKCGTAIRLNNILYDSNSSAIREDAKADLNKVVQFMKDNSDATIELSSHTDSNGSSGYNLTLSDSRAKAAADYIIAQGVETSKVIGKGYGETKLLNECADNVRCTPEQHQVNRRTEFKVICPD